MMTVFNNQLTRFLEIYQSALSGWYKSAPAHHWYSGDLQVGLNKPATCLVLPSPRPILVLQSELQLSLYRRSEFLLNRRFWESHSAEF